MSYPAEWREFYERHLLPREGGYVRSSRQETLLGVIASVWVDAIPNIPSAEIQAQPAWSRDRLMAIRSAPESQRPAMVSAWMRGVAQHLEPWGNDPGRTFERVRDGGNAAIVDGAHNLAFSVFYREYIRDTGISAMQVPPRMQETLSDSCIRYGEGYAYSLLARAIVSSGIRTEGQLNATLLRALDGSSLPPITDQQQREHVGYVSTEEIADGGVYRHGQPGYAYTTGVGRRAVASILQGLSSAQQATLFDEFGRWRRIYDMNKPEVREREGDMARTAALHGTYSEYNARREARAAVEPAAGGSRVSVAVPEAVMSGDMALVQSLERGLFTDSILPSFAQDGQRSVAIQLPYNRGVVRYTVKEELAYVTDSNGQPVQRRAPLLDQIVGDLPAGVELVREGGRSRDGSYRNPYTDGDVLFWREPGTNQPQYMVIGGEFNERALALPTNYSWYNIFSSNETVTTTVNDRIQFDARYSARVMFDPDDPNSRPGWAPPPTGEPVSVEFTTVPETTTELAAGATPAAAAGPRADGPRR